MNNTNSIRLLRLQKRYDQSIRMMLAAGDLGPQLKPIQINRVELSKDISHLKIYYNISKYCADPDTDYQQLLDKQCYLIQKILCKRDLRKVPKIRFIFNTKTSNFE